MGNNFKETAMLHTDDKKFDENYNNIQWDLIENEKDDGLTDLTPKVFKTYPAVETIIEGVDLNYDLLHLMGYLVKLGTTESEFPTEHICDLHSYFVKKYGNVRPLEYYLKSSEHKRDY